MYFRHYIGYGSGIAKQYKNMFWVGSTIVELDFQNSLGMTKNKFYTYPEMITQRLKFLLIVLLKGHEYVYFNLD